MNKKYLHIMGLSAFVFIGLAGLNPLAQAESREECFKRCDKENDTCRAQYFDPRAKNQMCSPQFDTCSKACPKISNQGKTRH